MDRIPIAVYPGMHMPVARPSTGLIWIAGLLIGIVVLVWVARKRAKEQQQQQQRQDEQVRADTSDDGQRFRGGVEYESGGDESFYRDTCSSGGGGDPSCGSPLVSENDDITKDGDNHKTQSRKQQHARGKDRRVQFDSDPDRKVTYDPTSAPSDTMSKSSSTSMDVVSDDVTLVDGIPVLQAGRSSEPTLGAGTVAGVNIADDDAFSYVDMPPDLEAVKKQGMPRSYWDKEYGDKVREENKDFVDLPPLPTHEQHMKAVLRMPAKQMMSGRTLTYARVKGQSTNIRDIYQPIPARKTSGLAIHGITESYYENMEDAGRPDAIAKLLNVEPAHV